MIDRHEFRTLAMEVAYLVAMVAAIACVVLIFLL
jgi:hypothetical protein